MKTSRLWRHLAISLLAAGPAGGFILGLLNAGDPDPNPIGRVVYACMLAVETPLHAGFPPHDQAGAGQAFNAWPYMIISGLLIFSWLAYRDRRLAQERNEPTA
jgi:hypothetical protein